MPIGAVENNGRNNNNMDGASIEALSSFVRAAKKPAPAMLSLASMMLATGAMAQEALPTIDVQETNNNNGGRRWLSGDDPPALTHPDATA